MIAWLNPNDDNPTFPPIDKAMRSPPGLLAAGGDLSPKRLLHAYQSGIFPWFEEGQPILWWSPDPRAVIFPSRFKVSRSLAKSIRNKIYSVSFDTAFEQVIAQCAKSVPGRENTWITASMKDAYCHMHELKHAHSVEVRSETGDLVGGLYGLAIGGVFFGESMFSRRTDASKVALAALAVHLREWNYSLIDCQLPSDHLHRLGAVSMARADFIALLKIHCRQARQDQSWQAEPNVMGKLSHK